MSSTMPPDDRESSTRAPEAQQAEAPAPPPSARTMPGPPEHHEPPEHLEPPRPPGGPGAAPLGRLVVGMLLLAGGVLWLLGALDVTDVPVHSVLPAALILVGLALVVGSRTGRHGGLITTGIVLTIIVALLSAFDLRFEGGVGERTVRPGNLAELEDRSFELAVGQLTIDLRDVEFPSGTTRLEASVAMGQLVIRLPADTAVRVEGTAGAGELRLLGEEASGLDVDRTVATDDFSSASTRLELTVSVGLGQVEVSR